MNLLSTPGGGGGVLPHIGYIGMCAVKRMVFKQFKGQGYKSETGSRIAYHFPGS